MNQPDQKKAVLVVDDAPANIQMVNSILKDLHKVRIAISGAKALELAKATPPPDLILLDVMMPDIDGYEVCSLLEELSRWSARGAAEDLDDDITLVAIHVST